MIYTNPQQAIQVGFITQYFLRYCSLRLTCTGLIGHEQTRARQLIIDLFSSYVHFERSTHHSKVLTTL